MTTQELRHSYELAMDGAKYPCGITVQPQIELFIKDKIRTIERGEVCFYGTEIYTVINQEESVRVWYDKESMINYIKRMESKR